MRKNIEKKYFQIVWRIILILRINFNREIIPVNICSFSYKEIYCIFNYFAKWIFFIHFYMYIIIIFFKIHLIFFFFTSLKYKHSFLCNNFVNKLYIKSKLQINYWLQCRHILLSSTFWIGWAKIILYSFRILFKIFKIYFLNLKNIKIDNIFVNTIINMIFN